MNGFYNQVVEALYQRGFRRIGGGKGSHEKWSNGSKTVIVPFNCKSRHTANGVMKGAGIKDVHF